MDFGPLVGLDKFFAKVIVGGIICVGSIGIPTYYIGKHNGKNQALIETRKIVVDAKNKLDYRSQVEFDKIFEHLDESHSHLGIMSSNYVSDVSKLDNFLLYNGKSSLWGMSQRASAYRECAKEIERDILGSIDKKLGRSK